MDEQYQEQLDVEKPPEELFKQNILMGDTGRSEIIGEETASEDVPPYLMIVFLLEILSKIKLHHQNKIRMKLIFLTF